MPISLSAPYIFCGVIFQEERIQTRQINGTTLIKDIWNYLNALQAFLTDVDGET